MSWFVYMVRCKDGSLYTGITIDVTRRVSEHNGTPVGKGAKYTKARRPVELVYKKHYRDHSSAAVAEAALKKLSRQEKLTYLDKT